MSPERRGAGGERLDHQMKALADATRREILHLVSEREVAVSELARAFDLTRPAVSQHLRVLLDAGLVAVREQGTRRLYSADRRSLRATFARLDDYWSLGLLELQRAAERPRRARGRSGRSG